MTQCDLCSETNGVELRRLSGGEHARLCGRCYTRCYLDEDYGFEVGLTP